MILYPGPRGVWCSVCSTKEMDPIAILKVTAIVRYSRYCYIENWDLQIFQCFHTPFRLHSLQKCGPSTFCCCRFHSSRFNKTLPRPHLLVISRSMLSLESLRSTTVAGTFIVNIGAIIERLNVETVQVQKSNTCPNRYPQLWISDRLLRCCSKRPNPHDRIQRWGVYWRSMPSVITIRDSIGEMLKHIQHLIRKVVYRRSLTFINRRINSLGL